MAKKKLTPKQMQIARMAPPRNKITGADFKKLKKGKKVRRKMMKYLKEFGVLL